MAHRWERLCSHDDRFDRPHFQSAAMHLRVKPVPDAKPTGGQARSGALPDPQVPPVLLADVEVGPRVSQSVVHVKPTPVRRVLPRFSSVEFGTTASLFATDLVAAFVTAALLQAWTRSQAVVVAVTLVMAAFLRLYRRRLTMSVLDDIPYLFLGVAVGELTTLAVGVARDPLGQLGPGLVLFLALLVLRALTHSTARRSRRRGLVHGVGLVVGAGHVGIRLAQNLQEHPECGVTPIGFIDSHPRVAVPEELPVPVLGDSAELAAVIERYMVTHVMVAYGSVKGADLVDVLRTCDRLQCEMFFVPRLFELHRLTRDMDQVWGIPLIRVRRAAFQSPLWRVKRLLDVLLAALALAVLSPVMALCALAVRYEGGPGVLFHQERVGLDGRRFDMLKFRSYQPVNPTDAETTWSISGDKRLGRVGAFLRSTSLDELPQLWNILRGRMTLVGPRPERPHFVNEFTSRVPRYTARHRVPAGLTGWAQVHGLRGDTSIADRAAFDNYYIENWSLWGDMKIVLRTVGQVLLRLGG